MNQIADGCPDTRFRMASIIFFSGKIRPLLAQAAVGLVFGAGAGCTGCNTSRGGLRINFGVAISCDGSCSLATPTRGDGAAKSQRDQ